MSFIKYQHLERLGTSEVQNIELGECYVFPKIDGSNASLWVEDGVLCAGSRRRQLTLEDDNSGFYAWALQQDNIRTFFTENPNVRLFGEWLVPHSLKTYKDTAWNNFYVFDVSVDKVGKEHEGADDVQYITYNVYKPILERHQISYIHPISIVNNGSYEHFINQLMKNVFLIEDGKGCGEGIVIKNYDFFNKYGRQVWAKIVNSEFKEAHAKTMGPHVLNGKRLVEEEIAIKYVTTALVEKEHSKIIVEDGWSSKLIPRLLNTVYYSVVKEDCWDFVKEHKKPVIDFSRLQHFVFKEVKTKMPQLF